MVFLKKIDIFIVIISVIFAIMKQFENSLIFPWHVFVKFPDFLLILQTFFKFPAGNFVEKDSVFPDFSL